MLATIHLRIDYSPHDTTENPQPVRCPSDPTTAATTPAPRESDWGTGLFPASSRLA